MGKVVDFTTGKQRVIKSKRFAAKQKRKERREALLQTVARNTKHGTKKAARWSLQSLSGFLLRILLILYRPFTWMLSAVAILLVIGALIFYFSPEGPELDGVIKMAKHLAILAVAYAIYSGAIYGLAYGNQKLKRRNAG